MTKRQLIKEIEKDIEALANYVQKEHKDGWIRVELFYMEMFSIIDRLKS